jgi:hypothetical protein
MDVMKEQMTVITDSAYDVNHYLQKGWKVISVTAQHIATGGSFNQFGKFCFILEK